MQRFCVCLCLLGGEEKDEADALTGKIKQIQPVAFVDLERASGMEGTVPAIVEEEFLGTAMDDEEEAAETAAAEAKAEEEADLPSAAALAASGAAEEDETKKPEAEVKGAAAAASAEEEKKPEEAAAAAAPAKPKKRTCMCCGFVWGGRVVGGLDGYACAHPLLLIRIQPNPTHNHSQVRIAGGGARRGGPDAGGGGRGVCQRGERGGDQDRRRPRALAQG